MNIVVLVKQVPDTYSERKLRDDGVLYRDATDAVLDEINERAVEAALQLKEANDAYQNSYAKLKGQVDYVSDMSKEMARQSKIDRSPEIDNIVGTGGPETVSALDHAADQL